MPTANLVKSSFTSGVLDPRLYSRVDIANYERGLQQGTNCVITPFGSIRRRGGLRHIGTLSGLAAAPRPVAFSINSNAVQYLLLLADNKIYFYRNGALIANINGSGNPYLAATPWPLSAVAGIRWAQTGDVMIMVHEDYNPRALVNGGADHLWTLTSITFDAIPDIDFNDSLSPTPTSEVQTIVFGSGSAGDTYRLDLEGVLTSAITWAGDGSADAQNANKQRIRDALSGLYVTGIGDIVVARTGAMTYTVTFQGGSARSYGLMTYIPVTGTLSGGVGKTTNGVPRTEPAWSATRGYPTTVCFYESRMVFGGTKSRPQTVFLSAINDLYSFSIGQGLDDDAIVRTLDTDQQNKITAVVPGRNLQVFTEGAEFYFPDQPITPENSGVIPQTTYGSVRVRPVQMEGATWFLDSAGNSLRQFVYSQVEEAYAATSASRLSAFLLNAPIDMAAISSYADDAASLIIVVNGDGTAAVLNSERSAELFGWTQWATVGEFCYVAALAGNDVYFVVARPKPDTSIVYTVERLDETCYTDCAYKASGGAPSTTVGGIPDVLWGFICKVRGNNTPMKDMTTTTGLVTLDTPVLSFEIGLGFTPIIQPMPAAIVSANLIAVHRRARLKRCFARIKDTLGLILDGYEMDGRRCDVTPLDTAPTAVSGVVQFRLRGWDVSIAPVITQDKPLPMHLLGIEYEVEIN